MEINGNNPTPLKTTDDLELELESILYSEGRLTAAQSNRIHILQSELLRRLS